MDDDCLFSSYLRDDPTRPTDWRWQNVRTILDDHRHPCPERDDADVVAAVTYFQRRGRCSTDRALKRLDREFPGVLNARLFSFAADAGRRFEVKARILGGQDADAIAAVCPLSPATVRCYSTLFFDVHERCRDWIRERVIGLDSLADADRPQTGRQLMSLGFHGGYRVLEVVLAVLRNRRQLPDWVAEIAPNDIDTYEARLRLLARLAIGGMTAKTPTDTHELQRVYRSLLRLHGLSAEDGESVVRRDLAAFLTGALTRPHLIPASPTLESLPPDLSEAERELLCPSSGRQNFSGTLEGM